LAEIEKKERNDLMVVPETPIQLSSFQPRRSLFILEGGCAVVVRDKAEVWIHRRERW
jgi:hypothetical protein